MEYFWILSSLASLFLMTTTTSARGELARLRLDGGSMITSSTLKWTSPESGHIPDHAIPVTEDDVSTVWCRARTRGIYVGGSFQDGVCNAPFHGQVIRVSEGFEILVSINGSSRVKRFPWDKYSAPPHNAIASSEKQMNFLAMEVDDSGKSNGGYLVPSERRVHLVRDGKFRKVDEASVLGEDEPIRYDLRTVTLSEKGFRVEMEQLILKETQLTNAGPMKRNVMEEIDITARHLIYWGRVKGTYVGRKALVTTSKPDKEIKEITWGLQNEFDKVYTKILQYDLPAGTATDVQVVGEIRKTEAPYIGTLTAIYEDGTRMSRVIQGLHMDERCIQLTATYSTPYFINNNTKLDVDQVTEILYKSTTTTTTTTTTTPRPPQMAILNPNHPKSDSLSSISATGAGSETEESDTSGCSSSVRSPLAMVFVLTCWLIGQSLP